ncbi:MAG: hypothetical protein LBF27_24435 [Sphingobacterium sp.]|jgi:YD repeat-containing protein|nr:hypothetical protein [Sphingobacterium sp.]
MKRYFIYKIYTVFICLILCISASAQRNNKNADILPPSPSSFALTRYGDFNVGLQTGTLQQEIPLYTIQSRKLGLPISLSYASNGVKVDEIASRAGISWVTNAGGVITRTVHDDPDESSTKWLPPADFTWNQDLLNYLERASSGNTDGYDTAPDFFSFNVNGYSGKFILSGNQAIQLSNSALKIETNLSVNNVGWKFRIIDPKGIIYYFGEGANSTESSSNSLIGEECGKIYSSPVTTAWYLTKMVHPEGDFINFTYAALEPYSYPVSISQSMTKFVDPLPVYCGNQPIEYIPSSNCENIITVRAVYLSEISSSSNSRIRFKYISRQDLTYDVLLDSVNIYLPEDPSKPSRSFKLKYAYAKGNTSYSNQYSSSDAKLKVRPFLTSLTEQSKNVNEKQVYTFEYDNIDLLPPRLSYSQDHFGYFNGKYNSGLIPKPSIAEYESYFSGANADRSPNFSYGKTGMLTRINFPTGGYNTITYTAPTYSVLEYKYSERTLPVSAVGFDINRSNTVYSDTISVISAKDAYIGTSFTYLGNPNEVDYHAQAYIYLIDITDNRTIYTRFLNPENERFSDPVSLADNHRYVLKCIAYGEFSLGSGNLHYMVRGDQPVRSNVATGGVVLDYVNSYDSIGHLAHSKRYYYAELNNLDRSTGSQTFNPVYMTDYQIAMPCHTTCGEIINYKRMVSNSLNNLYTYSQHHINFGTVIESFGMNFENGGIEHSYLVDGDTPGEQKMGNDILGATLSNRGVAKNGLNTMNRTFLKKDSKFIITQQERKTYKFDNRYNEIFYGYTVQKRYTSLCHYSPPNYEEFGAFDVAKNYIYTRWSYADTVETIAFDQNGLNPVVSAVVYNYDNPGHLQPSRVSSIKSNGVKEVALYTYPDDYASGTVFIDNMKSNHLIAYPIEKVNYKEVGSVRTILKGEITKYLNGGKGLVDQTLFLENQLPIALSAFKFSNRSLGVLPPTGTVAPYAVDNRYNKDLTFVSFDGYNNPRELETQAGLHKVYLWGYGGQYPIAEIKNATYAEVATVLTQAVIDNLNLATHSEATMETLIKNVSDKLRSDARLSKAMITSHTYKPLVGMTSKIDARGVKETYKYDGMQRLQAILDQVGHVTKAIDYHYRSN